MAKIKLSQLKATAYHEAGHAVIAIEKHRGIKQVSIVPSDDNLGHVHKYSAPESFRPDIHCDKRIDGWIEREILIALAGFAAECQFTGRNNWVGAKGDIKSARDLADHLHGCPIVVGKYLDYMIARTRCMVKLPHVWIRIEALAEALLEQRRLTGKEARQICQTALSMHSNRFKDPPR